MAGLAATDLGSSFEHRGRLVFLFGDSAGRPGARDALAFGDGRDPEGLRLEVPRADDGLWRPLAVPGLGHGPFEIPSYGTSVGDALLVAFTVGHSRARTMHRSTLAVSRDDGRTFASVGELSSRHFVNVAFVKRPDGRAHGLPWNACVFVFGSGDYRASDVRLMAFPEDGYADATRRRWFAGLDGAAPRWSTREDDAAPLFHHPVVGELSAAWCAPLGRWVMLYNASTPRGVVFRSAPAPWGPWSEAEVIFDPHRDAGYGVFLHADRRAAPLDVFHDPGKENVWGGEYGPYLVDRFVRGDADRCTLVYTMSTWNPYQVVLMRSDVGRPDAVAAAASRPVAERATIPGDPGWTVLGDPLVRFDRKGAPHVTTFGARGDAGRTVAHVPFRAGDDDRLAFTLHGGTSWVALVREGATAPPERVEDVAAFRARLFGGAFGEIVDAVAGPASNAVDVSVAWSLRRVAGAPLRLYVVDAETGPWGFVSVSAFRIASR
ncbi:MAG TPA: DUF4185 domain-containing protein [Planctomycetota bacterium]|nr:DUF4185 domain-containing protein [Planctomycetota bacterium]